MCLRLMARALRLCYFFDGGAGVDVDSLALSEESEPKDFDEF